MSNSTRGQIIELLRKCESGLRLDELCGLLNLTPMAVHRQLQLLESEGYVAAYPQRGSRGRPHFVYRLTENAESLFPKTYRQLLMDLLGEIRLREGATRIRRIFESRFRHLFQDNHGRLTAEETLDVLNANGYMAETEPISPRKFRIYLYNCPTSEVARQHPEICTSEQCVLSEVMGARMTRDHHILSGQNYCSYIISPKPKKN